MPSAPPHKGLGRKATRAFGSFQRGVASSRPVPCRQLHWIRCREGRRNPRGQLEHDRTLVSAEPLARPPPLGHQGCLTDLMDASRQATGQTARRNSRKSYPLPRADRLRREGTKRQRRCSRSYSSAERPPIAFAAHRSKRRTSRMLDRVHLLSRWGSRAKRDLSEGRDRQEQDPGQTHKSWNHTPKPQTPAPAPVTSPTPPVPDRDQSHQDPDRLVRRRDSWDGNWYPHSAVPSIADATPCAIQCVGSPSLRSGQRCEHVSPTRTRGRRPPAVPSSHWAKQGTAGGPTPITDNSRAPLNGFREPGLPPHKPRPGELPRDPTHRRRHGIRAGRRKPPGDGASRTYGDGTPPDRNASDESGQARVDGVTGVVRPRGLDNGRSCAARTRCPTPASEAAGEQGEGGGRGTSSLGGSPFPGRKRRQAPEQAGTTSSLGAAPIPPRAANQHSGSRAWSLGSASHPVTDSLVMATGNETG